MPFDQTTLDEKNNLVVVTLFESYLSRFVLENPRFYQGIYSKVFDAIHSYLYDDPKNNLALQTFLSISTPNFDTDRYIFSVFSKVNAAFPGYNSFETLKRNFNLRPSYYFIKILLDELFYKVIPQDKGAHSERSPASPHSPSFFSSSISGKRSPFNPNRPAELFNELNRGAWSIIREDSETDPMDDPETLDLGIVAKEFTPPELANYFDTPIEAARFIYSPNETSFVARWCRNKHLPVISGSSGAIEGLFSQILPLLTLTPAEIKMLVMAQACNMVACGHHSFFEALLVADHFEHTLTDTETLLDYYLQCIPNEMLTDPHFIAFLESEPIKPLLLDMPLTQHYQKQRSASCL